MRAVVIFCTQVFLSRCDASVMGGLPGLTLWLKDSNHAGLNVFGPVGCEQVFGASRSFIDLRSMRLTVSDLDGDAGQIRLPEVVVQPVVYGAPGKPL